jgi:hypothetical protein
VGDFKRGKRKGGRSSSHKEYCLALSVQRWMGLRLLSVNREKASDSENCSKGQCKYMFVAERRLTLKDSSIFIISASRNLISFLLEGS